MTPRPDIPRAFPASAAFRYHRAASAKSFDTPAPFSYIAPRPDIPRASPASAAISYQRKASAAAFGTPVPFS